MSQPLLSAVTYTKNNEAVIAEALQSLRFADEVLLLDSGSTDRTVEIAKPLVDRVEHRSWTGFRDQLNHIQEIARGQYVLVIDADERVSPELAQEIQNLLKNQPSALAFGIPRSNRYMGRFLKHGELWPDVTLRLYKRGSGHYEGEPHAKLVVPGETPTLKNPIIHLMQDHLSQQLDTMAHYTESAAQEMFAQGQRHGMAMALFRAPARFFKAYIFRLGFLDGWPGFVVALTSAFAAFMKYARLSELERSAKS